jgi:hypothetical protein
MAADYTYLLADLRTNAILAELPLQPQTMERRLAGYGQLRGTVNLGAKGVDALDLPALTRGGRTAVYVDRDGVLVWGGILWSGRRQQSSHQVALTCMEFESYFQKRLVTTDYTPTDIDQLAIARALVNTAQAVTGGNIGITVGSETSGVLRTREYLRSGLPIVGEALRQLTEMEFGFDLSIEVAYDSSGVPQKYLRLGYPQLGRGATASGFVFESPGNIVDWTDEWDAFGDSCTDAWELGEGEGSSVLLSHASNPATITAGNPVLERKGTEHRTVSRQDTLNAHAREQLASAPVPVQTYSCTVKAGADPVLGSYIPGDAARFVITDDWYRPGGDGSPTFDDYLRLLGWSIDPENDLVNLTLGAAR